MSSMANQHPARHAWKKIVESHVDSLRFGVVQIVVHDSRVVQIERTEKVRLSPAESRAAEDFKTIQETGGQ